MLVLETVEVPMSPGKKVADEFYIHLSVVEMIQDAPTRHAIERAVQGLPATILPLPNVAKYNMRTGRVSLLSYPSSAVCSTPMLK